jgi:hypothetical protein
MPALVSSVLPCRSACTSHSGEDPQIHGRSGGKTGRKRSTATELTPDWLQLMIGGFWVWPLKNQARCGFPGQVPECTSARPRQASSGVTWHDGQADPSVPGADGPTLQPEPGRGPPTSSVIWLVRASSATRSR